MDKNKKYKRQQRLASIDGIVSGGSRLGTPVSGRYKPNHGRSTPTLDSLVHRNDGFHAARHTHHGQSQPSELEKVEALLDEPIVLDDQGVKAKKKHRLIGEKHSGRRRVLKRAALSFMALIVVGGAYFGLKLYITQKHLFRGGGGAAALADNVDLAKLKGEGDGRINVLLLGNGGPGHEGPDLTDTILLASIDPVNHTSSLLSIPRDLWVKIPGDGYQKLNAAYVYGKEQSKAKNEAGKDKDGLALVDKTLEPILGVTIHYHAVVNFSAFKQTVNTLGGVTFNVPETLYDPTVAWENRGDPYIAKKGTQTFNGDKALLYARSRETSSDFARGERQRQLIVAIKDKVFSAGTFSNPVKISGLLSTLGNNVYTDFSLKDLNALYKIMGKIPSANIVSLDLVTPPHNLVTTGNMNGLSIVQPNDGLFEYDPIQNYVRNALKDGFIAKENAQVAIYNATDVAGIAASQSKTLKSFGYNITTTDSTPTSTNPPKTKVIDLSKGNNKYTKNYLEGRFKTTATTTMPVGLGITPPTGTAFVIILGQDVANPAQN
jgi:LCP family protein required for cell wall assembly